MRKRTDYRNPGPEASARGSRNPLSAVKEGRSFAQVPFRMTRKAGMGFFSYAWLRPFYRAGDLASGRSSPYTSGLEIFEITRSIMPRVCYFTGKKTTFGNQVTHRGKAKYLGGVGTKVTGITARKFRPNIQKVRAVIDGQVVRVKVSAKALRNGLVVKPVKRRYTKPAE